MDEIIAEVIKENNYPQFSPSTGSYLFENLNFLEAIIKGEKLYPGLEIGYRAHEIIEKAYQSSRENRAIFFN
jgi:predicted dehydrogenase